MASVPETATPLMRLKHYLVDQDIQEAITYSFVDPATQAILGDGIEGVRMLIRLHRTCGNASLIASRLG